MENECKHKDGWVLKEEIALMPNSDNDSMVAEFECNTLGCHQMKEFTFDVSTMKEV
jgi:hypothetical protein|tara:strand:- start:174 stop:341 length:168 start_codon:yes stop_codon:yes gene_type:complete